MASFSLTQIYQGAMQYLMVLDSGEGGSTQQIADALAAANDLLDNWTTEQAQTINVLLKTFTMLNNPTFTPGTALQFADATTPLALPAGYGRALKLAMAVELAPQYDTTPSPALIKNLREARPAASILAARISGSAPQADAPENPGAA
jgi:hypothetical protein